MKKHLKLIIIIIIASALRLYQIDSIPALNADEAAVGYNAYSLILTGKDEHRASWPIEFQSFNDYKPGGYFYLVIPFVKLIGLTELAVRLPNAILGITAIYITFLISQEIYGKLIGTLSAGLLAISPWHIHFSRGGWEVNAATTLLLVGLYLYIKSIKNPKFMLVAPLFLAYSMYTYHSMRLVVPLLLGYLTVANWNQLKKMGKTPIISAIFLLILSIPIIISLLSGKASSRFQGVGLFADKGPLSRADELRSHHSLTSIKSKLIHNRFVEYGLRFIDNYIRHFSGNFLFVDGDEIQRNKVPGMGLLYLFEIITVPLGLISVIRDKSKLGIVIVWLLIAPIPSSLTFQSPQALRAQNMVIPLIIISSLGLAKILEYKPVTIKLIVLFFAIWNFSTYLHQYYYHLSKTYPYSSQYGFKEMINSVKNIDKEGKYEKIVITNKYDQPYILTLFYLQFDPSKFQSDHILTPKDQYGFSTVDSFDRFEFHNITTSDLSGKSTILVGTNEDIPTNIPLQKVVNFPNGLPAYKIATLD